jgi:hypothetical protein
MTTQWEEVLNIYGVFTTRFLSMASSTSSIFPLEWVPALQIKSILSWVTQRSLAAHDQAASGLSVKPSLVGFLKQKMSVN